MIRIAKGLDIPLEGEPRQQIETGPAVNTVALVSNDYIGMKPAMQVQEGDEVQLGQPLFSDRKVPGVVYTSPGCGRVQAIHRGAKRRFESIVIELSGDEERTFQPYYDSDLSTLTREQVCENLVQSGLWTSLRTRPYSRVPSPESVPHSLFVTAMDTNPLSPWADLIIQENDLTFRYGLQALRHLTPGRLFLCRRVGVALPGMELDFITNEEFDGPHPAGLAGTHIHFLDPVGQNKVVWHIGYQDVIAIGRLFTTGKLSVERIVSLAGPVVKNPRLIRTRLGAAISGLIEDELAEDSHRVISGSVLCGRAAVGSKAYLGRYHQQISVLAEGRDRVFLGWQGPGFNRFSVLSIFASAWMGKERKFPLTTSTEGSVRAMVPIGSYERVLPLDMVATPLLRSLIIHDTEQAQALGALELDEEDLALCTFVCPGKYDYGPLLRQSLASLEREG